MFPSGLEIVPGAAMHRYVKLNDICYKFHGSATLVDYQGAVDICTAENAHLPYMTTHEEFLNMRTILLKCESYFPVFVHSMSSRFE